MPDSAKLSAETLELMGKRAATMYIENNVPLNESISKMAGDIQGINEEQIKRVAEYANTATYVAIHERNKTSGAQHSYPRYNLADPDYLVKELSDGARPTEITESDLHYSQLPEKPKVSSSFGDLELAEAFNYKKASDNTAINYTRDTVLTDVLAFKGNLEQTRDNLRNSCEKLAHINETSSLDLYSSVKQHVSNGGDVRDVLSVAVSSGLTLEKASSVLKPFLSRLIQEKVASFDRLRINSSDFEKISHRVINDKHPMVSSLRAYVTSTEELEKTSMAIDEIDSGLSELSNFLKDQI